VRAPARGDIRRHRTLARAAVACLSVAACHREAALAAPACRDALAGLAAFFTAVAADLDASPQHAGVDRAEVELRISHAPLVTVRGTPRDTSASDYLVIGPAGAAKLTAAGDMHRVTVTDTWDVLRSDGAPSLVIAISPDTPWSIVQALYSAMRIDPADQASAYRAVGLAYQTDGAFTGRTPPSAPAGATADSVDIVRIGNDVAGEASAHCPALAAALSKLGTTGTPSDRLRTMAVALPHCNCDANLALFEAVPWLLRRRFTVVVPIELASKAPTLPAADSTSTFGEVVRANGGKPIMFAVPPLPPPPPRPRPRPR
jgi:hypothetical protein